MTICAVTRVGTSIQLATDSRLSWGKVLSSADIGVKIMSLPLTLIPPTDAATGVTPPGSTTVLGLAFTGSSTTSYVAKDVLGSIFSALQYAEGVSDISLSGIAALSAAILERISRDVCQAIFESGVAELILVGWCPVQQAARAFRLGSTSPNEPFAITYTEILLDDDWAFYGSGTTDARLIHQQHPTWQGYRVVHHLSHEGNVSSVGGPVQIGLVEDHHFAVKGVRDFRVDHTRREVFVGFFIGGVELLGANDPFGDSGMVTRKSFIAPFEHDINELLDQGYNLVDSTAHWNP